MKQPNSSNELMRYTTQMYLGMFSGLLLLAAVASCLGLAGNWFDLTCFLSFSLISSSFCVVASESC